MGEPELVFEHTVEGLVQHALKGRITPRLHQRLKTAGLDVTRKLAPAYERHVWASVLQTVCEETFPQLDADHGMRELGKLVVNGYAETFIGKALQGVVK